MYAISGISAFQIVTLFSFGFIGALIGGLSNLVTGAKRKKATEAAAAEARKQRAHEERMARLAAVEHAEAQKSQQTMLLAIGGIAVVGLFIFKRGKK